MKFHSSQTHLIALGLLLICAAQANAADLPTTPVASPATKSEDALKFLAVSQAEQAFKTPLDLSVENASLEQVVARLKNTLSARRAPRLPHIEIRGVQPVKLTFSIKNSTPGGVLNAAAALAGGKLWVLGDYAVIAPDMSLSAGELAAKKDGLLSSWIPDNADEATRTRIKVERRKAFSSFIASEIAQGGITGALPNLVGIKEPGQGRTLDVNSLSPDARQMLSLLVGDLKVGITKLNINAEGAHFNLVSQDTIHLNDTNHLFVNFQSGNRAGESMRWRLDGKSMMAGPGTPLPDQNPNSSKPVSPLTPSAGDS